MDAFTTILSAVAYISSPAQPPASAAVEELPQISTLSRLISITTHPASFRTIRYHASPIPHDNLNDLEIFIHDDLASFRDILNLTHDIEQ
ncbi:hypothetical protein B0H12DRAFT_1238702 [Mycena haematopus]|nr:hypothetical protein B0H12DRAFT_1238702 [Mycena haematopus]